MSKSQEDSLPIGTRRKATTFVSSEYQGKPRLHLRVRVSDSEGLDAISAVRDMRLEVGVGEVMQNAELAIAKAQHAKTFYEIDGYTRVNTRRQLRRLHG